MDDCAPEPEGGATRSETGWSPAGAGRRYGPLLGTVLVIGGLIGAAGTLDGDELIAAIASADLAVLTVAGLVYVASWPLRGRRYGDVLVPMGHRAGAPLLTAAVFVSQSANLVIPARAGDAVRAYVVNRKADVPYTAGVASLAVERLFDLATITAIGGVAVGWLVIGGTIEPTPLLAGPGRSRTIVLAAAAVSAVTVVACLVVVTATWTPLGRRVIERVEAVADASSRLAPVRRWLNRIVVDVGRVAANPRTLLAVGGTSLLIWGIDVGTAVLVLVAVDGGLPIGPLLVVGTLAVSVGNLAKVLPLSQGGVGLYEAAFTAIVVGLTPIGPGTALAAAVLDHALKNAITVLGGAAGVTVLGLSLTDVRTEDPTPEGDRHPF